jgi:hypothetical protein
MGDESRSQKRLRVLIVGPSRMDTVSVGTGRDVTIGSSPACDIVIDDPTLAERHALLRLGSSPMLTDLGAGATKVGGAPLGPGETAPLSPGVVMTLGSVTLVLQKSGASTDGAPAPAPSAPVVERRPSHVPPPPSERERIEHVLEWCRGNHTKAARMLGVSRETLLDKIDSYGIPRKTK